MKIIAYASNQGAFNQLFSLLSFIQADSTIYLSHGALLSRPLTDCNHISLKNIKELKREYPQYSNSKIIYALVGLSSYSFTDELEFLAFCKQNKIQSFAIQDYPGFYGNFAEDMLPDFFLIPDTFPSQPFIYNHIPHIRLPNPYNLLLASDPRRTKLIKSHINILKPQKRALFLQPLHIKGMIFNFQKFLQSVPADIKYDVVLHPEDYGNTKIYQQLPCLNQPQFRILSSQADSLSSLAACTTLVTSYSTVALQLDDSFFPFATNCDQVHYLFAGSDIKYSFRKSTLLQYPPMLKNIETKLHLSPNSFSSIHNIRSIKAKSILPANNICGRQNNLRTILSSLFLQGP